MAYDIGPRIGIEGEKDFRKAIQDINTNLKTLGTEMQAVTSAYDKNDKSTAALAAQNEVLNKQIDSQKQKLQQLTAGLESAKEKYGENDKVTQGWQQAVNKATADLNNMERQLKDNNGSLDETKKGLDDAGKSAEDSGGKFEKLGATLKASAVAMGAVAAAAGAAALKLGKEVVQQFGELEQNLGGSEAVFGEYAKSIQKTGEDAYKNLGVSQSDYLATANKMGALFQGSGVEQQKSLELTEKAMQRAADMASVMGIDMQVALDSVAGAAKGNFTMMDNLGVAMNATNIEAYALSKGLDFTWKTATQAEKAEVAMQMFFENTEQYAGNFANEATQTVTGSIGLLQAALGSFTAGLGNADADMQNLTQNLVDAFQAVVTNIVPIIENIASAIPTAFDAILGAVGELLPTLLDTATNLFKQVSDVVLKLLPGLIPVAVAALMTVVDTLIENLPLIIESALTLILALGNGIIEALPELIPAIVDTMLTVVDTLINNIDMLIEASIAIIVALAAGLIDALPKLIEKAPEIVQKLVEAIIKNVPKLLAAAGALITMLVKGITENFSKLGSTAGEIVVTIVAGIAKLIPDVFSVGVDVVKGLWEGIKSMWTWIKDQVSGFFSGIIDGVKGVLGIQSPSKVFAGIGEYMADGLGQGFENEMRSVAKQINSSVPTNIDMTGQYQMGSSSVISNTPIQAQGQPVNITITLDGKILARQLFDPLQGENKIRGQLLTAGT